jgi:hypothetical protein
MNRIAARLPFERIDTFAMPIRPVRFIASSSRLYAPAPAWSGDR